MIRFNCNCSHEFLVDEDQAGGLIQCPKCGRLNDIPALSDLQSLEDGGIYKMDVEQTPPKKTHIPSATRAFTHERVDESGDEIDLRHDVDEFLSIGAPAPSEQNEPVLPKYDPLTGELVEDIDIKPDARPTPTDVNNIPIAKRAISYASGDLNPRATPITIAIHLFQPMNVFVMLFVVAAHVLLQMVLTISEVGFFFMVPVLFIVAALILAHYGTVIDELGPGEGDELPRPLRNLGWTDDLWGPFIRFMESIFISMGPAIFAWKLVHNLNGTAFMAGVGLIVTCFLFGVFFFPAILLTTQTSGTTLNLRFDRLIGVIRACGVKYWIAVALFFIATPIYLIGMLGVDQAMASLFTKGGVAKCIGFSLIFGPTLLLGIYLYHLNCWFLGLMYRANHARFPWVLQRHVGTRRTDLLSQLEAARAASRLAVLKKNKPDREARIAEIRAAEEPKKTKQDNRQIWDRVAD